MLHKYLIYLFTWVSFSLSATVAPDETLISKAIGASLQGDASKALTLLGEVEQTKLTSKSTQFYQCLTKRFESKSPTRNSNAAGEGFTAEITRLFRAYWHSSLLTPSSRSKFENQLNQSLFNILKLAKDTTPLELDTAIRNKLKSEGNYALLGQTGVLRELMIWSSEQRKDELVKMPHGEYRTSVAYLDEFIEPGWGMYATCEQRGAGGWVADRTLFAVVPRYKDINSEEFKVTFLGHETQHFLDLDTYHEMASWELEYRAKLMELSMAEKTLAKVLRKFMEDQRNDPAYPHSYANYILMAELVSTLSLSSQEDLYSVEHEHINRAAISLFNADTNSRQ